MKRKEDLEKKEKALTKRESALVEGEKALAKREIDLAQGENARAEKERELSEKEKKLFGRKRKMIYKAWLYIMRQSAICNDLWEINSYLLRIYSIGGSETVLNLMNAYMNLTLYLDGLMDFRKPDLLKLEDTVAWKKIQSWDHIWIDDVSYDKHTEVGKELGRGVYFFYRYGGKVANKKKEFNDLERKFYNKLCEIGLLKEKEEREHV